MENIKDLIINIKKNLRSTIKFILFVFLKKVLRKKRYKRAYLSYFLLLKNDLNFLLKIFRQSYSNFSISRFNLTIC